MLVKSDAVVKLKVISVMGSVLKTRGASVVDKLVLPLLRLQFENVHRSSNTMVELTYPVVFGMSVVIATVVALVTVVVVVNVGGSTGCKPRCDTVTFVVSTSAKQVYLAAIFYVFAVSGNENQVTT